MKKFKSIFVFIFLAGMCFTLYSYFPSSEEEGLTHSIELIKKNCQDNTSGNDGQGDDNDPDIEKTDLWDNGQNQLFDRTFSNYNFLFKHKIYKRVSGKINTRPPQV